MKNLSFPKDMTGYSQKGIDQLRDPALEKSTKKKSEKAEEKKTRPRTEREASPLLKKCNELLELSLSEYGTVQYKELYDAIVHLRQTQSCLSSINFK